MDYTIAAIPTRYNGTQFRSRLEARWAAFFDLCEWKWEYEPIDLDGWIPDFVLKGHAHIFVEIKPVFFSLDDLGGLEIVDVFETQYSKCRNCPGETEFLCVGASPHELKGCGCYTADDDTISCIGFFGTRHQNGGTSTLTSPTGDMYFDEAIIKCKRGIVDIGGNYGAWMPRLTTCKDHHPSECDYNRCHKSDSLRWSDTEAMWREAGNIVQWHK